jgi:hypothetical protein
MTTTPDNSARFLEDYLAALAGIDGWLYPDAALLFMAYHQANGGAGSAGDTLEVGVHHGKSAIAVAALRGPGREFVAVDLFEKLQDLNTSASGSGSRSVFMDNMRRFHSDLGFVRVIAGSSGALQPSDLGAGFSFCHVDGGHSAAETYHDLHLAAGVLVPGGLVGLDDHFNPAFPGVCEGASRFMIDHPGVLSPVAIGYNKVLFQKVPATDLNARFDTLFPRVPRVAVTFWDTPARLFETSLMPFFDVAASTPQQLKPRATLPLAVTLEPSLSTVHLRTGQTGRVPVRVVNRSAVVLDSSGKSPLLLSYHLLDARGRPVSFDNVRTPFPAPLGAGEEQVVDLRVIAPGAAGSFRVEVDVVWEGVTWFKDAGSPTAVIRLDVTDGASGRAV